jgi:hypothetical protein
MQVKTAIGRDIILDNIVTIMLLKEENWIHDKTDN